MNFCTLFDKGYLSRGLLLYYSLKKYCNDFSLYILSIDDICYDALRTLSLENVFVTKLEDFENDTLKEAKKNRTHGEYCWTCSSWSIKYFIETYNLDSCTYLDADLYFFSSPYDLINSFNNSGCSVGIITHNFGNKLYDSKMTNFVGKYNVAFNTFKNSEIGLKILYEWCQECIDMCKDVQDGKTFGDQKILDTWKERYGTEVYEYCFPGANVAPWNIYRFSEIFEIEDGLALYDKITKKYHKLYFIHFHGIDITNEYVDLHIYTRYGKHNKQLIERLFFPYIRELIGKEQELGYDIISSKQNSQRMPLSFASRIKGYFTKIKLNGVLWTVAMTVKYRIYRKYDFVPIYRIYE